MLRRHKEIRSRVQMFLDAALFGLAWYLAHALRQVWHIEAFGGTREIDPFTEYAWVLMVIIPLSVLSLHFVGFYRRPWLASRRLTVWQLAKASVWTALGIILITWLLRKGYLIPRAMVPFFSVIGFGLVYAKEELLLAYRHSSVGQAQAKKRVVLLGTCADTARLRRAIERDNRDDVVLVGELDINREPIEELVHLLHEHSVNGVVLSAAHTYFGQIEKTIEVCEREGVEVWLMADFFKTQISQTRTDEFLGRPTLVFTSVPQPSLPLLAKQSLDFVGATVLLLVLAVPLLLVALAIKLTSPGPVLFRQQRAGLNGRPFTMLKFRSMVTDAEQRKSELEALNEMTGPVFKVTNDPRITPIGRWLRKYSVDELPQLINVWRGEMSLVGPRPLPVDEVRRFDDPAHRRRLSVKPGLTCLWQVSGRNNLRDFQEWVRLDLEYIDNWSLWLDLRILARTVPVVLAGAGAK
jgi:exopolysaccharide biosynthesis polyprenyl glycosylphosphotransferase